MTTNGDWDQVDLVSEGASRFKEELHDYDIRRLNSVGPISFQGYLYALIRAEKPVVVVETGVRSGVSTCMILAAMERNGCGELHSCDPIYQGAEHAWMAIEAATGMRFPEWHFHPGKSETALEGMPNPIDMFIHDSNHDEVTMAFELEWAWETVVPGGLIVCDDWSTCVGHQKHDAFLEFVKVFDLEFFRAGSAAVVRKPEESR